LKADCQDTTTVVGKSATITCTFSETVSRVERPFLVTRFPLDSADFPDYVVDCTSGHCEVADGYIYTERAGLQQFIEIPSAEKRLEGIYQCQYDTREPQDATPCTLLVQGPPKFVTGQNQTVSVDNDKAVITFDIRTHTDRMTGCSLTHSEETERKIDCLG
ncbi:hypothetical protein BaRGS_00024583, partial [Batillaria attramentaria]